MSTPEPSRTELDRRYLANVAAARSPLAFPPLPASDHRAPRKIMVPQELFDRLIRMRDAYGDTDIAGMLDRLTEVPAASLP